MAEPGRCASCRWWFADYHPGELAPGRVPSDWRGCVTSTAPPWEDLPVSARFGVPAFRGFAVARFGAIDSEGYAPVVWTAPDFGCVQWVARHA